MQVIPVIDVRGGVAVAARRGDRARYRPLETPLAEGADPVAVAQGLRTLFPFQTLYVADLDGIEGRGADRAMQHRLVEAWPGTELWIDDGSAGFDHAGVGIPPTLALPTRGRGPVASHAHDAIPPPLWGRLEGGESLRPQMSIHHVLGAESLASLADYDSVRKAAGPSAPLSLDFRGDDFLGPPALLDDAALWPGRIIVMTLARVGSGEGPDLPRLASIIARAGARKVYAAGGVRNADDLNALRDIGAAGALVATALHDGQLTTRDLEEIAA
jgi:uncharacterized protein related to proFAR isomerase